MLDLLRAAETVNGYTIRVWTGLATDEGVGLIALAEIMDGRGVPVCRFEEFIADVARRREASWPRSQDASLEMLQERALERARVAVLGDSLREAHGHRFDIA